ncbi:serine/threonine-protein kinase, partial [Planctomycetota bacterium]
MTDKVTAGLDLPAHSGAEPRREEVARLFREVPSGSLSDYSMRETRAVAERLFLDPARPPQLLEPGAHLGPFVVTRLLGEGGQGVVYEGKHSVLDRSVALKVPRREVASRILKEARTSSRLDHPLIVRVEDVDPGCDPPYLVMELMTGGSLRELLDRHPKGLPLERVQAIAKDVLDALAYVHGEGVVHRDVKPANILFDLSGRAKLADLGIGFVATAGPGLSQSFVSATSTGTRVAGTPLYMAPEQECVETLKAGGLDGRADLYAFGKILYEMLTGRQARTIKPPSRSRPELDPAWDDVVFRLLEERPEDRYLNALAVMRALTALHADKYAQGALRALGVGEADGSPGSPSWSGSPGHRRDAGQLLSVAELPPMFEEAQRALGEAVSATMLQGAAARDAAAAGLERRGPFPVPGSVRFLRRLLWLLTVSGGCVAAVLAVDRFQATGSIEHPEVVFLAAMALALVGLLPFAWEFFRRFERRARSAETWTGRKGLKLTLGICDIYSGSLITVGSFVGLLAIAWLARFHEPYAAHRQVVAGWLVVAMALGSCLLARPFRRLMPHVPRERERIYAGVIRIFAVGMFFGGIMTLLTNRPPRNFEPPFDPISMAVGWGVLGILAWRLAGTEVGHYPKRPVLTGLFTFFFCAGFLGLFVEQAQVQLLHGPCTDLLPVGAGGLVFGLLSVAGL